MLLVFTLITVLILLAVVVLRLRLRAGEPEGKSSETTRETPPRADDRKHIPLEKSPELADFIELSLSAKQAFSFLSDYGLTLAEERLPQSSHVFDGFLFKYTGGEVAVEVEYSELEYVITFSRKGVRASYLLIDKNLFGNRSGYQGSMFMRNKLADVIAKTAADIQQNYEHVIRGDVATWKKIEAASNAPTGMRRLPP